MLETGIVLSTQYFSFVAVIFLILLSLPLSAFLGWVTGHRIYQKLGYDEHPPKSIPGAATMSAMLALLGLLTAFTFGFALNHAQARKAAQVDEAAALTTAFLRADLLEGAEKLNLQEVISEYAITRATDENIMASKEVLNEYLQSTIEIQSKLWPATMNAIKGNTEPPIKTYVASGVTDVLDTHTYRLAVGLDAIPPAAKLMVLLYAAATLFFVGNHAALCGRKLTWRAFVFALALAAIMVAIEDFERSREGLIQLDTTIMKIAIEDINAMLVLRRTGGI
ncbi:hypothetical protein ROA7450_03943 [Roseovarius albus]|uniref:DUF4239 domain-containing protein n=1 Tax=Roseovarius albus TaxID=1247867 RepID=A0A1X7A6L6_9RHOB|nr:hypothetical protein [Roseovarius albus]SLN71635.1 hypothetical protein ROA7450_03943 [Roseovarius albus]